MAKKNKESKNISKKSKQDDIVVLQETSSDKFWIIAVFGLLIVGGIFFYFINRTPETVSSVTQYKPANTNGGNSIATINYPEVKMEDNYQVIEMNVTSYGYSPNKFVLKQGVPVKWRINGKQLNGCNNAIKVPRYNLQFGVRSGIQDIEFTPEEIGVIQWSCSMGMIRGSFIVVDDVNDTAKIASLEASAPPPRRGGCGMH